MDWLTELAYGLCALFHWRFIASVGASIAGALLLSKSLASFTAGWCVSLVLVGADAGLFWQAAAADVAHPKRRTSEQSLSKPLEALALAFVGLVLGSALASAFNSLAIAALGPVAALAMVGLWSRVVRKRTMPLRELAFYAAWPLVGFSLLLLWVFLNR